jgi:COP9 signalosome complex subunit 2
MSDDEYEYDDDEDMGNNDDGDDDDEDQEFEYTDDEEEQDDDKVRLENAYYNAKSLRDASVAEAAEAFEQVIAQASSPPPDGGGAGGESAGAAPPPPAADRAVWAFKALKQLCKLHLRAGSSGEFLRAYGRLLGSLDNVSPNAVEKGIGGMVERMSALCQQQQAPPQHQQPAGGGGSGGAGAVDDPQDLALRVYGSTLDAFHPARGPHPNDRLWFRTNLRLGQLLYERGDTPRLQSVLRDLAADHRRSLDAAAAAASASEGGGHQQQGGMGNSSLLAQQSLEIHALQMQLYSRQKDYKRLRETYRAAVGVVAGTLPHPRTIAVIQELGGKMYMAGKEYGSAEKSFFQAFKSYDEAGDVSRLRCLKYLVLASMLHASAINPFDSQEARPYRDDAEIVAMTGLVHAFHANDVAAFEGVLRTRRAILRDDFIREHVEDLLRTIRRQVLRRVLEPYSRITLRAVSEQFLNDIDVAEVEGLLVGMILDGLLPARIDKVSGVLHNLPRARRRNGGAEPGASSAAGQEGGGATAGGAPESLAEAKLRAVESLADLISAVNREASSVLSGPSPFSSSSAPGGRGAAARAGPGPSSRGPGMPVR